jgi:hypothetical protein
MHLTFYGISGSAAPSSSVSADGTKLGWNGAPQNDIRKYRWRKRYHTPEAEGSLAHVSEEAISVPQSFHFLHPATSASGRFFSEWWNMKVRNQ